MTIAPTKRLLPWWIAGYAALIAAVVGSVLWARQAVLSGASTTDWEQWRSDVIEKQNRTGVRDRAIPKSIEPPALVLMTKYFAVMMTGAIFFTSLLYWIIAWFVTGIMRSQSLTPDT